MKGYKTLRKEIARFMRRLYDRGLTTASGGNISVRVDDMVFITPSAIDKGLIRGKDIGILSLPGKNLTPHLKPSIESAMHIAIYKSRPDVLAIVHAHPFTATSFTAMNKTINCTLTAEAHAILGTPVFAPYALMGTPELAGNVAVAASGPANVILLENHGIVCLGNDLLMAFDRLEVLETAARMTYITAMMGDVKPLADEQLKGIDRLLQL
jgi:L-fuculose-phosphate aldolase